MHTHNTRGISTCFTAVSAQQMDVLKHRNCCCLYQSHLACLHVFKLSLFYCSTHRFINVETVVLFGHDYP